MSTLARSFGSFWVLVWVSGSCGLLGICSGGAFADESQISATNTLDVQYRTDNRNTSDRDDNYGLLIDRLNINASAGNLTGLIRADAFYFDALGNAQFDDSTRSDDLRLERVMVRHEAKLWTITGGDFYRVVGRGLAMSLRKVDEAAVDVTLRGGQVELHTRHHQASLFGGLANTTNLDSVSLQTVENNDDILAGGHYETSAIQGLKVGAHGVYSKPAEVLLGQRNQSITGGLTLGAPSLVEWMSWSLEGDFQQREVLGKPQEGWAAYATTDFTAGDAGLTLEGLYLKGFEQLGSRNSALGNRFVYNQAPTLERIDQEVGNNRDVLGGRARVEYLFPDPDLLLYLNAAYRVNEPGDPGENNSLHVFAGSQQTFQDGKTRLFLSGGYRDERKQQDPFRSMIHGEVDYLQWLTQGLSLHLQVLHESRTQEAVDFLRGSTILGLEWSRVGSLTFEFGYDTQNPSDEVRQLFYAGIMVWDITPDIQFRFIGGTQRGGIRCIAGVCRNFPAFSGAQTLLIARF